MSTREGGRRGARKEGRKDIGMKEKMMEKRKKLIWPEEWFIFWGYVSSFLFSYL